MCSTRSFGVSVVSVKTFNVFAVLLVLGSASGLMFHETYQWTFNFLTREHGPVELTTFLGFLAGAVLSARLALRARAHGEPRLVVLAYAGFALFCLLCWMEEISWGQALVYYATPFGLGNVNEQGEFNIHNLPGVVEFNDVFLLVFGLAGLVGIRVGSSPRLRKIPVPRVLGTFFVWISILSAFEVLIDVIYIQRTFDLIVGDLSEAIEMLGALSCFVYAWLNGRMLTREWSSSG